MTTLTDKIERLRELVEQAGNAMAAGLIDDLGDPELVEMAQLVSELDDAGALAEPRMFVHVVDVRGRDDGIYAFADPEDAQAFEATVNADADTAMGSNCWRTEEAICGRDDALKLIAAECEASPEAERESLNSGIPVATRAWAEGEDAPYPDKLKAVKYVCYRTDEDESDKPWTFTLLVGLDPEYGAPNVDAGRERLEAEGWEVTDWAAA
jgi:hypothetical protein